MAESPQITERHGKAGAGLTGYRKGCRCTGCSKAKSDDNAAYRARRKLHQEGGDVSIEVIERPAIEPSSAALDWSLPAGEIESALAVELDQLIGEPPFKKTLIVLGKYNARVLDQIPRIGRPDLISGVQSRLFNVFDRLRAVTTAAGGSTSDPNEFLLSLANPDD